uniref:Uncharacterized protein n=1 Tax=Anguilla anguilla TaxID=7936 RepID=A0A0E9PEN6_ANGAN
MITCATTMRHGNNNFSRGKTDSPSDSPQCWDLTLNPVYNIMCHIPRQCILLARLQPRLK